jgi:hypothetical protein
MAVISSILSKSVSSIYETAKNEWVFAGVVNDYGVIKQQQPTHKCQLCGHAIRYGYMLKNSKNNNETEVGSECVDNYMIITQAVANKMEIAKKKAKNQIKINAQLARDLAGNEAHKVINAVQAHGTNSEKYLIGRIDYNPGSLINSINSGLLFNMAKKYNVTINMNRINAFIENYKHLDWAKL